MTAHFIIKIALPVIWLLGFVVWGAVVSGYASEAKAGESSESAWNLVKKYASPTTRRFLSRFILIWVALAVIYLVLLSFYESHHAA